MVFQNLEVLEISRSAPRTLNVQLGLTSFERLVRVHSIASALAPWRSDVTPIGGMVGLNHAFREIVQNVFRVHLGVGIRGWLFILNGRNEPTCLKSRLRRQKLLRISGPKTPPSEALQLRSIVQTGRSTVRFVSDLDDHGVRLVCCLRARTWRHCWRECGQHGRVTIPRTSPQRLLWSSPTMRRAIDL